MSMGDQKDSWTEWKQLVLHSLKQQVESQEKLQAQITELQISIAKLQVKAGVWGAAAGAIPAIVVVLVVLLKAVL